MTYSAALGAVEWRDSASRSERQCDNSWAVGNAEVIGKSFGASDSRSRNGLQEVGRIGTEKSASRQQPLGQQKGVLGTDPGGSTSG
jgi:hypothetical protein